MGIEHERVHLETSSVLIRQLPVAMVTTPPGWNYAPAESGLIFFVWIRRTRSVYNAYFRCYISHAPFLLRSEPRMARSLLRLSWRNKAGLDICPSVRTPAKSFSDSFRFWHFSLVQCLRSDFVISDTIIVITLDIRMKFDLSSGICVMHDGMPHGPIQGQCQGQGHVTLKFRNSSIFKIYLLRHFSWELASDCWFFN